LAPEAKVFSESQPSTAAATPAKSPAVYAGHQQTKDKYLRNTRLRKATVRQAPKDTKVAARNFADHSSSPALAPPKFSASRLAWRIYRSFIAFVSS